MGLHVTSQFCSGWECRVVDSCEIRGMEFLPGSEEIISVAVTQIVELVLYSSVVHPGAFIKRKA